MFGDLWFEDYVRIGDDIWFAAGNYNGLYKFNIINKEVNRVAAFPEESMAKDWAFKRVKLWEGQLVFMPSYANAVYLFDTEIESFKRIDIFGKKELLEYQTKCKFQSCVIYEEWLYLIGFEYPGIIKVNLKNGQIKEIENMSSEVLVANTATGEGYFGIKPVVEDNIIFVTCFSSNKIFKLDMSSDCYEVLEIGNSKNRYTGICKVEDVYYLILSNSDNILRWERDSGNCTEIELKFNSHFVDREICETQNYIWILSFVSNEVYRIDKRNQHISKILLSHSDNRIWLAFCEETPKGIYFLNMNSGEWHILREDGTDENLHFTMKEPDKPDIMIRLLQESQFKNWSVLSENNVSTMELLFLKVFDREKSTEKREINGNCGKTIYEMMASRRK